MEKMLQLGNDLPKGEAKVLNSRFKEFKGTLPEDAQRLIPDAVCYSLTELQDYLAKVNEMMVSKGIPPVQQGIALMFGKYDYEVEKPHLANKVTVMFLASRLEGNEEGRITKIENCIIKEGVFERPAGEVDDVSYDVGSLQP